MDELIASEANAMVYDLVKSLPEREREAVSAKFGLVSWFSLIWKNRLAGLASK